MAVTAGGARSAAPNLVLQGICWAVAAAMFHSLVPVAVRWMSAKFPAIEIVFLRNLLGFLFLLALYSGRGLTALRTKRISIHIQRSLSNFIGMWMWFYAIGIMPIGQAIALHFTTPLWAALLAVMILRERPGMSRWVAIGAGFVGVMVILRPGSVPFGWASAMVLASASLYAMTTIYTRVVGRTDDAGVTTFYYQFFLMAFSAGPALWTWVMPSWSDMPAILMLGAVGTIAPYCIIRALKSAEATVTAPFDFLRMPFTTFMGFLFFNESTSIWVWVGGAIIFGATYYMTWREARAHRG